LKAAIAVCFIATLTCDIVTKESTASYASQNAEVPIIRIGDRSIGPGNPVYIVAELSANHKQELQRAIRLIHAAKEAGADAVKLQTYTPDTITIRSDTEPFRIKGGTLWDGRTLYDLYAEAFTPWEWHLELQQRATSVGLDFFSSPFDPTAVDFLETLNVPAYKIASPEIVDIPLIQKTACTGKPLIMSTGMATSEEIAEAITAAHSAGVGGVMLLKCTSAYPSPAAEMNLRVIPMLARRFGVPVGLSDHTTGIAVPVAAVALGACLIEKHLTLSRSDGGPDSEFSLEPHEFKAMVEGVRTAEAALGEPQCALGEKESATRAFRRSLFVVEDMRRGDVFTEKNVRSIRPANGLHTRYLREVLGRRCSHDVVRGTPLEWDLVVRG
jgi:pseudaminic acid synthase